MDSTVWLRADRPILAHEYMRVANYNMPLRPSTDSQVLAQAGGKGLMITNFSVGQQLTYQVYVPEPSSQISLRYCGYSNSICEVTIDGKQSNYIDMPRNGTTDAWAEASIGQSLSVGRHTITLSLFSGNCYLSALKIQ